MYDSARVARECDDPCWTTLFSVVVQYGTKLDSQTWESSRARLSTVYFAKPLSVKSASRVFFQELRV
eukprot:m.1125256 g.1125256  ORF g.1125256 m.1125256 type:complete len:67 (+) comp24408_c0_seq46:843-1043(+)